MENKNAAGVCNESSGCVGECACDARADERAIPGSLDECGAASVLQVKGVVKCRQLQRSSFGKGGPFRFVRQLLGGSCFFDATRFAQEQRTLHAHEDLRCRAGMFSHAFVFLHFRLT